MTSLPPHPAVIAADQVDVWSVALEDSASDVASLSASLSRDERARAARYHFDKDRRQFIIARGVLRNILASCTGVPPQDLRFGYSPLGKPGLHPDYGSDLHFSVSHTDGRALYGITRGRAIGVDIELVRHGVAHEEIATRFFSPKESATLRSLPEDERTQAFFRCWTRKEAYVKALGGGLSIPFDRFEVTLRSDDPVELQPIPGPEGTREPWSLWEVVSGPDYIAAVAAEGRGARLTRHEWRAPAYTV